MTASKGMRPYLTSKDIAATVPAIQRQAAELATHPQRILDVARLGLDVRRRMVENMLFDHFGGEVQSGPFAGMRITRSQSGSLACPRLLGCYEQELHAIVRDMGRYRRVLNVGCAEGWYAVGLARLFPALEIVAFDINPAARRECAALADANGVAGRVDIRALFDAGQLAELAGPGVLVLMDIEGAETEVLRTARPEDTRPCDWLIETHILNDEPTLSMVTAALGGSHDLAVIEQTPRAFTDFPILGGLGQLDRFLAQWEGRCPESWVMAMARGG